MPWLKNPSGDPLAVSMSSIKLGDRLLMVGSSDVDLIVALAAKAGLTGRTCMVDESPAAGAQSAARVEREGALVESFTAPYSSLPFEVGSFDVVVIRKVIRMLAAESAGPLAAEIHRVLRPGGRCIVIEGETRRGLAALFKGGQAGHEMPGERIETLLTHAGFRGVRTLAEREGLLFVEGVKPNTP